MAWDVRPTKDLNEFKGAVGAISHYFGGGPDDERAERFAKVLPLERMHAAFDGDAVVGGAGAFPFQLTVPGGIVPCGGVTVVGVLPTHRRRGVLTAMMRAQLEDIRDRGEPIAALWASEEVIYGRFGYGMASLAGSIELPREYAAFARPFAPEGRLRFVEAEEAAQLFPRVWNAVRRRTPGMLSRTRAWWEFRILFDPPGHEGGAKRFVVLERDGRPEGYAVYRHKPNWENGVSNSELEVVEAIALDGRATAEVWRYLFDVDWAARITAFLLPVDHPLLFLLATPRRMRMRVGDGVWARLVDVGAALSARSYAADGAVVFDVIDDFCPWNTGRWRLADGVAKRSQASPQLRCDVTALGSAFLGGFSFSELVRAGRIEELRRGAAARADAMFASERAPWCPEIF